MQKKEVAKKGRYRRHQRARATVSGTKERPRISVFRSSGHIYAQLIDDERGKTLASASDQEILSPSKKQGALSKKEKYSRKSAIAYQVGGLLAERALNKKISKVVFDKSGYRYHGRVKALAEGARDGGLKF